MNRRYFLKLASAATIFVAVPGAVAVPVTDLDKSDDTQDGEWLIIAVPQSNVLVYYKTNDDPIQESDFIAKGAVNENGEFSFNVTDDDIGKEIYIRVRKMPYLSIQESVVVESMEDNVWYINQVKDLALLKYETTT